MAKETEMDINPTDPVYDYDAISNRLMNDKELIRTVVDIFLADIPKQIAQLKTAIADNNIKQISDLAHIIKGASANVGGMALSALAFKIELSGKAADIKSIQQSVSDLERMFTELETAIKDKL